MLFYIILKILIKNALQSVPYESSSSVQDKRQMVKQCLLKALSDTVSVYQHATKALAAATSDAL